MKHRNEYEPGDAYEPGDDDPVCINRYELIKCVELCRQAIDRENIASYFALKALLFLQLESEIQFNPDNDFLIFRESLRETLSRAPWPKRRNE